MATFRPVVTPPFQDWGIGPIVSAYCIRNTSSRGTLDGLSIGAPCGTIKVHSTHGVGIEGGKLRLQSCQISAPKVSGGNALNAWGPRSEPAVIACQLSGGLITAYFSAGAKGKLANCQISGAGYAGLIIQCPSTSPVVSGNEFRDS